VSFFQLLEVSLQVSAPLLILLIIGIIFKRIQLIDDHFVAVGNKVVFKVALPCLLFLSMANKPDGQMINFTLIIYAIIATFISVASVWILSPLFVDKTQKGVFTQCAFRGNMGIIGIALCLNAYGETVLAQVSVYLAFLVILYNILSVILLSSTKRGVIINLVNNPLIIAITLGYLWSTFDQPLPQIAQTSISYLAKLTLPLALLCIGASLEWSSLKENHKIATWCSAFKLVILPLLVCIGAVIIGIKGESLGILFLMMSTPTAAAAYVMSQQMTDHGRLAAEVITLSTILSPITVTLGLVILKYLGHI
jgi:predicted permease